MKKDREILEENLREVIQQVKHSRKKVEEIDNELNEFNVLPGVFSEISRGIRILSSLDIQLLCLISLAIYNATKNENISPYDFFTENEIESSKKYYAENQNNEMSLPLDINDVIMIDFENYVTKIKMSSLVKMFHSQLIIYDYETQRSAKYKRGKDGVVPVPDVNRKSVKDISEHMLNETYLADMITLNVYSNEVEPLNYNAKNKTLTINKGATISILDGFHRLQAGVRAVSVNPNLDLEMILSIRSYDTDTAKKYFGQINTINSIKPERLKELKSEKHSDLVVKDLQIKSDMKGKIASASRISTIAGQLTTFDVLSYAIDKTFSPSTTLEAREVSNYLVDFFNYLVGSFVDEFLLNPNDYRDTSINHPLMFAGYVQIAYNFKEQERPLREIKDFVENIDFRDDRLQEILKNKRGINFKRNRDNIIEYFRIRG
ncbi:DNA sulfur modification protein DndB [Paenibacillus faecalis]|uniref:DNA sulfur modification protein DndB n=1 Tax=Paenibacillus faecalis TaxID=2079532 RepID=UPI000D0E94E0|nr:DNA sulfur modification protein DndB [Paenibacillus faecalis]